MIVLENQFALQIMNWDNVNPEIVNTQIVNPEIDNLVIVNPEILNPQTMKPGVVNLEIPISGDEGAIWLEGKIAITCNHFEENGMDGFVWTQERGKAISSIIRTLK